MTIIKEASAGTDTSGDVIVTVAPAGQESIEVQSPVGDMFGDAILHTVREVLEQLDAQPCAVRIQDRGALDYVLRARTETALRRAGGAL